MQGVVDFEIPVSDLNRAVAFYEYVFSVKLELRSIDNNDMALFPKATDGVSGALAKGESYKPSVDGTRVYFRAVSIDEIMNRAIERGGVELFPKTDAGNSYVAEFKDCEGSRIALHSSK